MCQWSQGAGRENEDTLGSHWQVFLVIVGQARNTDSKRLLTLMIGVCFPPTPRISFQANVVLALVLRMTSSKGDRQSPCRQMVVRSNNEYLQVSAQTNVYYPSVQWSLSVKDTYIDSRGIHQQKALIPSIGFFVTLLNKMSSPSSGVIFSYVQLWKVILLYFPDL